MSEEVWEPTAMQERMDLLKEFNEEARGTLEEWCRLMRNERHPEVGDLRVRWHDDGSAMIEDAYGTRIMRVSVEITVSAVEYRENVNEPTGFVLRRTWGEVPAGWFVRGPDHNFYEVLSTKEESGKQLVTLRVNGNVGTWPRDPHAEVQVKKGTSSEPLNAALEALTNAGFKPEVKEDAPPWD